MRVIITCAGKAVRWGEADTPKQLAEVEGVPILHRTMRLLDDANSIVALEPPIIVARDDTFALPGADFVQPPEDKWWASTLLSVREHWGPEETVCLLGDVHYTDWAIQAIFAPTDRPMTFWGRMGASLLTGSASGEFFAMRWHEAEAERLAQACDATIAHAEEFEDPPKDVGCPWQVQRHYDGIDLNQHANRRETWVTIDDWTEDFDTQDQYRVFVDRYARRWVLQQVGEPCS